MAVGDQGADAVGEVVLHAAAPLAIAGLDPAAAIAARSAEVGLEHQIAAGGEELRPDVEAQGVARLRSAVRQDDHRQRARVGAGRAG